MEGVNTIKDFLEHYDTILESCYSLGRQNKLLFEYIIENDLIEEWNAFYNKQLNEE